MNRLTRPVTERLDGWIRSRSAGERVIRIAEAGAGLASLAVLVALVWRLLAPAPAPWLLWLTAPIALAAALAYGAAGWVVGALPRLTAAEGALRAGLADALQARLGKDPRDDLEAIVRGAVDTERIRAAVDESFEGGRIAERVEQVAAQVGDELADDTALTDTIFDEVLGALAEPENRRALADWLGALLADESELIDGIARPVTRKLIDSGPLGLDYRPFSWRKLNRRVQKFLDSRKGQRWTDGVIGQVLDDLQRQPRRAQAVRATLMPLAARAASRRIGGGVAPRLGQAMAGEGDGAVDAIAEAVAAVVEPALLGALAHAVEHRAVAAVERLTPDELARILRRASEPGARRLQLVAFVAGGALGALAGWWS